jgi:hypothetical protein
MQVDLHRPRISDINAFGKGLHGGNLVNSKSNLSWHACRKLGKISMFSFLFLHGVGAILNMIGVGSLYIQGKKTLSGLDNVSSVQIVAGDYTSSFHLPVLTICLHHCKLLDLLQPIMYCHYDVFQSLE